MMKVGPRNLITDVEGLLVGNAQDDRLKSGTTVLTAERPFVAAVDVRGGAPGTRETDLLAPDKLVETVDAIVLSGGSAFGLDAASGVMDGLHKAGRGFEIQPFRIPLVPAAIIFDMMSGGDKNWDENPYRKLGTAALQAAKADFVLGSAGAGTGATTANLKGGLGSASLILESGIIVGALVVANPSGSVTVPGSPNFWAAPFEAEGEFGGLGHAPVFDPFAEPESLKRPAFNARANTTIAIVATNAALTKAQAQRLATNAHDGIARAIVPAHTPFDGDLVFAVATGTKTLRRPPDEQFLIGHAAAVCLARAIARAVHAASPAEDDILPTWREKWATRQP